MNIEGAADYKLIGLEKINIILGKNGCGKSTLLRALDTKLETKDGLTKYISPERGGYLQHDPNLEHNINRSGLPWISQQLRNNQYPQFKQQCFLQFRKLEMITLREIEKDSKLRNDASYTFDSIVKKINNLLTNIEILRVDSDFEIRKKGSTDKIGADKISSGESELISLAIECLYPILKK